MLARIKFAFSFNTKFRRLQWDLNNPVRTEGIEIVNYSFIRDEVTVKFLRDGIVYSGGYMSRLEFLDIVKFAKDNQNLNKKRKQHKFYE